MKHVKLIILSLLYLTTQNIALGQTDTLTINNLIDKISWNSISIDCEETALALTHENITEKELLKIGKPATEKLIQALSNPNKTAIAHIILTQIWSTKNEQYYLSEKYIYKNCNQLIGWHHIYNGLVWEWSSENNNTIRQSEIDKIKNYWSKKTIHKKTSSLNFNEIVEALDRQDKEDYPCTKIYNNNSKGIKYKELEQLFEKKSDDISFKKLWDKFGNDSIVGSFEDCFFITYSTEGLSFRFKKDSTLNTIFVDDFYEGELPFKLKISDRKRNIEKKIGLPIRSSQVYENSWSYYTDKDLSFCFDKEGRIIEFCISKE